MFRWPGPNLGSQGKYAIHLQIFAVIIANFYRPYVRIPLISSHCLNARFVSCLMEVEFCQADCILVTIIIVCPKTFLHMNQLKQVCNFLRYCTLTGILGYSRKIIIQWDGCKKFANSPNAPLEKKSRKISLWHRTFCVWKDVTNASMISIGQSESIHQNLAKGTFFVLILFSDSPV